MYRLVSFKRSLFTLFYQKINRFFYTAVLFKVFDKMVNKRDFLKFIHLNNHYKEVTNHFI